MNSKIQRLAPFFAAMVVFSVIYSFLLQMLPGIGGVEIDMEIDHPDTLRMFYSYSNKFQEASASSPIAVPAKRTKVKVSVTDKFVNYLRIDTGGQMGVAKIYQVKISSYFHQPLILGPQAIGEMFLAGPDALMQVFPDHVQVSAKGSDPYLIGKTRPFPAMYWQVSAVAGIFALVACMCLQWTLRLVVSRGLPVVSSVGPAAEPERMDALDGLRGIAATMVIADHTCGWFTGVGATGVWIFFALSGFLLARPFIGNAQIVVSFAYMAGYFRRRFMRILPMYYAYIFVIFIMSKRFSLAFSHALFLQGDGHLWALPQEIVFYLLWPCVVLLVVLPLQRFPRLTMVALFLAMAAWNRFVGLEIFWLLGMAHNTIPVFFGVFLTGVFFSFLYTYWLKRAPTSSLQGLVSRAASPLGIAILLIFILFSTGNIVGQKAVYSQDYFSYYGFLAGLLIFCILCAKGRILDTLLRFSPMRELGKVGLSLYLVHPAIKSLVESFAITFYGYKMTALPLFLATLVCSYILARYTFGHIEQPGFLEKPRKYSEAA